jgi:hypothetical protein
MTVRFGLRPRRAVANSKERKMRNWTRAVMLSAGLIGAAAAGGCAGEYYDNDGYHNGSYRHDSYYGDRRHRGSYRDSDDSTRVRVCDADGDDCHWEYRRR